MTDPRKTTLVLLAALGACGYSAPSKAEIVVVECEPQMGLHDCRTVVEVDGRRYSRAATWGEVGDSLIVQTHSTGSWR